VSFASFIEPRGAHDFNVVTCALNTRASPFRQF
jgi:hypothetical protein